MNQNIELNGASRLRKAVVALIATEYGNTVKLTEISGEEIWILSAVSTPIRIRTSLQRIYLAKFSKGTAPDATALVPDFSFEIRTESFQDEHLWWPVSYQTASGEIIKAESESRGRTMVNNFNRRQLLELADTWAKSLLSQSVSHQLAGRL